MNLPPGGVRCEPPIYTVRPHAFLAYKFCRAIVVKGEVEQIWNRKSKLTNPSVSGIPFYIQYLSPGDAWPTQVASSPQM